MFHVTILFREPQRHSLCFVETARLLLGALGSLGHEAGFRLDEPDPSRLNLVLGYHNMTDDQLRAAEDGALRFVPYQLEQLHGEVGKFDERAERILRSGERVWEYSAENAAFLAERGIGSDHVPVGHHPCLESIAPAPEKDIDVLFFGCMNERRERVLVDLEKRGARVLGVSGVYMEERDRLIERSKIVLNVHYYPMKIMEVVRLSYLVANGVFTVTEESAGDPWPRLKLPTLPYESLVEGCLGFLERDEEREALAQANRTLFARHYPMTRYLAPALQAILR